MSCSFFSNFYLINLLLSYTAAAGDKLAGLAVLKEGGERVLQLLREKNLLLLDEPYAHRYPYAQIILLLAFL